MKSGATKSNFQSRDEKNPNNFLHNNNKTFFSSDMQLLKAIGQFLAKKSAITGYLFIWYLKASTYLYEKNIGI